MKFLLIALTNLLFISQLSLTNGQATTITPLCKQWYGTGVVPDDFLTKSHPLTELIGTPQNYSPSGIYKVTMSNGADQCCYNCKYQSNGKCTSWTYDGCGNCYLSSAPL